MVKRFDGLDLSLLSVIWDYLDVESLRCLDEAADDAEWWRLSLEKLQGNTALESARHDLFDLDWMMDRGVRVSKVVISTAKLTSEYPFLVDPEFFHEIKDLSLQGNAFAFVKDMWIGASNNPCNMNLDSLSLSGEQTRHLMNQDLEPLLLRHALNVKSLELKSLGDGISDDLFIDFSQALSDSTLTKLSLHFCERGTDLRAGLNPITFMCLAPKCSTLIQLELRNTYLLTDECLLMLSMHCNTLEVLVLQFCRNIEGAGVRILCHACPNMKQLILLDCTSLNDSLFFGNGVPNPDGSIIPGSGVEVEDDRPRETSRTLAEYHTIEGSRVWEKLEYIALDECEGFSNTAIRNLALLMPNLERLSATNCFFITDESLEELYRSLGKVNSDGHCKLEEVCLYGISGVGEDSMRTLMHVAPALCRVGFTATLDNEIMKDLEGRGVLVEWIPWWRD